MKKFCQIFMVVLLTAVLAACGDEEATGGNNEDGVDRNVTITIGVTPWTSTIPPTYIVKEVLEDLGYDVELMSADAGGVFAGLARGDIDVFMDSWLPDMHRNFMERYADDVEELAVSYTEGELGWVVPTYMEDINSIEDIIGNEDTIHDQTVYGIEEGAPMGETSRAMIEDFGLDLEYMPSSEGGMLAQAQRIIANEEPVIFLGWRPHPMFVNFDLKVLEGQEGYFDTSEVRVIGNAGLNEKAPEVYDFLRNWSIDVTDIEEMIIEYDENGVPEEEMARNWIENNQDKVDEMLGNN